MPEKIFIDTSAFFALKCQSDKNHANAISIFDLIVADNKFSIITSNLILYETVTLIKVRLGNQYAIDFGKAIRKSEFIEILWIDEHLDQKSWEIFDKYSDKDFSFIDCSSFALMKNQNISKSFAFDKHFEQFGFYLIP